MKSLYFHHFIYHIWRQCCMSKLSNLSIARSGIRTHASGSNLKLAPCTTRPYWIWCTVYLLGLFIRCSINGLHFKKFSQNKIWTCILWGWLPPERSALDHSATLTELQFYRESYLIDKLLTLNAMLFQYQVCYSGSMV